MVKNRIYDLVELLGRCLLAALFLVDGWIIINNYQSGGDYLAQYGVPRLMLAPALLLHVVGGIFIVIGWQTRLAGLALALFCIATALIFHTNFGDPNEKIHFWKDLAIAGGFLLLLARGAGAYSLDARQRPA
jgi:putative oxidoreductase